MVTATFRFHGVLNDFLPRLRREQEFSCRCARASTTKHMIEALGIPHTEVGMVLLNGEAAGMSRMLAEGDRVEIFPNSGQIPAGTGLPFDESGQGPRRFVADAHLGGLARLLRMTGFDTVYDNQIDDDCIVMLSQLEDRIALSRDRELLKRKNVREGCYVHALAPIDQLREIFIRLNLAHSARPFSLCLHCNAPLHAIAKAEVLERVPESVRLYQQEFSVCDICHRVYWKGSHWQKMQALMRDVGIAD